MANWTGQDLSAEDEAWADAYRIVCIGASNPAAAASALARNTAALLKEKQDTAYVKAHPALRAIAAHVAFLFGQGLGPEDEGIFDQIEENASRLGIFVQ